MKIELNEIPIREIVKGYVDSAEEGCIGYGGKLNIRPAFQREFVYKAKQRDDVINSIKNKFPLNVMYWLKNDKGTYEMMDGQQRTISICKYVSNEFSIGSLFFKSLTKTDQEQILNYKLMIYICEGNDKEKLDWFKIINIAGTELTAQELRNAIYSGSWLNDAKARFSKPTCPAKNIAENYLNGSPIRQDYLETVLKWIATRQKFSIEDYMSIHQHDPNCNELWLYFQNVINWVKVIFPKYRREMKGLNWGIFYNKFGDNDFDTDKLEERIVELMEDDDVTSNSGIYEYLLDGDERHLSIRKFSIKMKRAAYERQKGICYKCKEHFDISKMHADHIKPWSKGGRTVAENCKLLCADCNRRKSNK